MLVVAEGDVGRCTAGSSRLTATAIQDSNVIFAGTSFRRITVTFRLLAVLVGGRTVPLGEVQVRDGSQINRGLFGPVVVCPGGGIAGVGTLLELTDYSKLRRHCPKRSFPQVVASALDVSWGRRAQRYLFSANTQFIDALLRSFDPFLQSQSLLFAINHDAPGYRAMLSTHRQDFSDDLGPA